MASELLLPPQKQNLAKKHIYIFAIFYGKTIFQASGKHLARVGAEAGLKQGVHRYTHTQS